MNSVLVIDDDARMLKLIKDYLQDIYDVYPIKSGPQALDVLKYAKPDVILLDGGLGQLHAVHESLREYDLSGINIIAISKGVDRNAGKEFYHQVGKESFALPYRSAIAFYLQNLRDEAHRFAIGTHRKKRAKSMSKSGLDDIEGIGAKRKRDLLNYFGSVERIKDASIEDIAKVAGINKKTAENIYNYFHK